MICNLQKTPKDRSAALCIRGYCDVVMSLLMQKLGVSIPHWSPREGQLSGSKRKREGGDEHATSTKKRKDT